MAELPPPNADPKASTSNEPNPATSTEQAGPTALEEQAASEAIHSGTWKGKVQKGSIDYKHCTLKIELVNYQGDTERARPPATYTYKALVYPSRPKDENQKKAIKTKFEGYDFQEGDWVYFRVYKPKGNEPQDIAYDVRQIPETEPEF